MAYLAIDDYHDQVQADILQTIINADDSLRTQMELKVESLMSDYFNVRFDVANIFNKTGTARNHTVVLHYINMVVYHLCSRLAPSQVPQTVSDKYSDAIEWLKMVAAGKLAPDLPTVVSDGVDTKANIKYGSETKRTPYY